MAWLDLLALKLRTAAMLISKTCNGLTWVLSAFSKWRRHPPNQVLNGVMIPDVVHVKMLCTKGRTGRRKGTQCSVSVQRHSQMTLPSSLAQLSGWNMVLVCIHLNDGMLQEGVLRDWPVKCGSFL